MFRALPPPPLSLYIHLPWCVRKCPYCDFNSHEVRALPENRYIDALLADLDAELPLVWGRRLESVFIGGGTPSLFSAEAIDRLMSGIRARLPLRPDMEITLEANPGTAEQARFAGYRKLGINRLSIGVQSFDDGMLSRLGRIHGAGEAREAIAMARAAGFDNINLDLMFGLPEQSVDQALADLDCALALEPEHLSWYELTLEANTLFARYPPKLPDDDALWAMQETGAERLRAAGFEHYEVSAHARPRRRCRHNLNYWEFGDYLGIGAGAHGKLSLPQEGRIIRRWKQRQPEAYMRAAMTGAALAGENALKAGDAAFEYMLNALRLRDGASMDGFTERTGLDSDVLEAPLAQAMARGLLTEHAGRWVPTELGRRFLNDLVGLFLPAD